MTTTETRVNIGNYRFVFAGTFPENGRIRQIGSSSEKSLCTELNSKKRKQEYQKAFNSIDEDIQETLVKMKKFNRNKGRVYESDDEYVMKAYESDASDY
jgi:hypothetical protein